MITTEDHNSQDTQLKNAVTGQQRWMEAFLEVGKRRLQSPGWWHRLPTVYEMSCNRLFSGTMATPIKSWTGGMKWQKYQSILKSFGTSMWWVKLKKIYEKLRHAPLLINIKD